MIRLFETHRIREARELDGMWDFKMDGFDKKYQLPVPGCWEQHPDFLQHRGKGTYTRKVYIKQGGNIRLEFKGVSHTADVYFDGEKIAHHYNAFTPFSAVVKNVSAGEHEIKVEVDNTFGEHSALHIPNDYYTYGGITRPVALESVSDVYIKNVRFTPYLKNGRWNA
ncbi:MAG: sugar-binding domain-containing protein, partial [Candidatus Ornithomonoglobus sp.]